MPGANDLQIQTQIMQSEANGLYQKINDLKKQREALKITQDTVEDKLLAHVQNHGKVLAYKNDVPYILYAGARITTKLDKAGLANDLGVSQNELTALRMAELVEEGKLTAQAIKSHMFQSTDTVLKSRKANKNDMQLIFGK